MIFEIILMLIVGISCTGLGISIWKNQNTELIHSYHHRNIRPEDMKGYTSLIGNVLGSLFRNKAG